MHHPKVAKNIETKSVGNISQIIHSVSIKVIIKFTKLNVFNFITMNMTVLTSQPNVQYKENLWLIY